MQRSFLKILSLILLVVTAFSLSSFTALAAAEEESTSARSAEKKYLSVSGIGNKNLYSYYAITLYFNKRSLDYKGRVIGGVAYIPVRKVVADLTSAKVSYSGLTKTLTVYGGGYDMSVSDGAFVFYASGRPIFSMTPSVVLSDGEIYSPVETLSKALGLTYSAVSGRLYLSGEPSPLPSANRFYREDAVYWLSRIINAESRGESLLGQIAVGNVVLNRVNSPLYPGTIWGVIFDKKYGVQFSPIIDGSIYAEPTYTAVLAAKICLEGFSLSNDALFFLYPRASTSSWIPRTREYAFSIGKHDFYK